MPIDQEGTQRVLDLTGGLHDRPNPVLIGEGQASDIRNVNLNRLSVEESRGLRRLHADRPRAGAPRLVPGVRRDSVIEMDRWRDGYLYAPSTQNLLVEPSQIDCHVRLTLETLLPPSGSPVKARVAQGLSGRTGTEALGDRRIGGEHQFFPVIARGAREVESPRWGLGLGVLRPDGYRSAAGGDISAPDRIQPVFYWWDAANYRLLVTAADFTIHPRRDYSLSLVFGDSWYVNGQAVAVDADFEAVPAAQPSGLSSPYPIYFGRAPLAEPNVSYARVPDKHAFMGKRNLTVSAVGAGGFIGIFNQEMALPNGNANSYVGYRLRCLTGANAGEIYEVIGNNNRRTEATFELRISNASTGIAPGDTIDVIPPVEPISADATIQECRLWNAAQTAERIATMASMKGATDLRKATPLEAPLLASEVGGATKSELIAYWPMDDDEGLTCRELVSASDAYFGPSLPVVTERARGPSGPMACWLDGETQGIQVRLADDPNFSRNYAWNLGRDRAGIHHWNVCVRMDFAMGSSNEDSSAGTIDEHLYRVLFSLGDPNGRVALEARLTRFGGQDSIYFLLPDGTAQTIPLPANLDTGVWFNAIMGIEALNDAPANPNRHRCYFQYGNGSNVFVGGFSNPFDLGDVGIDVETEGVLSFGASVNGTADLGSQSQNHAMIGLTSLGYGFHPAHVDASSVEGLLPFFRFDELDHPNDIEPLAIGEGAGVDLEPGSRRITVRTGRAPQASLRRWPLKFVGAELRVKREGEADLYPPDYLVVDSVSGQDIDLTISHTGRRIGGSSVRAQLWTGYTNFETLEPAFDTDLNTSREEDEDWALTEDVFSDLGQSIAGFDMAIDPAYEFSSPFKTGPFWDEGIVRRLDIEVSHVAQYKRSDEEARLMAVAAGSVFEVDERRATGRPEDDAALSLSFRGEIYRKLKELESQNEGSALFSEATRPRPGEAVRLENSGVTVGGSFATKRVRQWEFAFRVPSVEGRRTLIAKAELIHGDDGLGVARWLWRKEFHIFLDNGALTLEIQDDQANFFWRMFLTTNSGNLVRPGEWHHAMVELQGDVIATVETLTGGAMFIDGQSAGKLSISAPSALSNVPQLTGPVYLGAIGTEDGVEFLDGLGGEIAGFRFNDDFFYAENNGLVTSPHVPVAITDEASGNAVFSTDLSEEAGPRFKTSGDPATFVGRGMVHIGSGIGDTTGRPVSSRVFGDVWYVTTRRTRPWRYDLEQLTPAGIRPPVGRIKSAEVDRDPLRILDQGADVPEVLGGASTVELNVAAPNLLNFAGSIPIPSQRDVGCLVWVPSDPTMGALGVTQGPGFIAVVDVADAAGYETLPVPFSQQATVSGNMTWELARRALTTDAVRSARSYKNAIAQLESTSPWGQTRLQPTGSENNDIPRDENLSGNPTNDACLALRGNHFVEVQPFTIPAYPVGQGKVLSFKCYLRLEAISTYGDDEQVIAENAVNADSGSWRLVVFDGGRLRFEFFDTNISDFRSIQTSGRVITAGQWFYIYFRYRWKDASGTAYDRVGGWEADLRWSWKTGNVDQVQKVNDFRDGLWVYACEGLHQKGDIAHADADAGYDGDVEEGAPCGLLTLPGSHNQFGDNNAPGTPKERNHSQHLCNAGLLKSAPYLTPERGDRLFPGRSNPAVDSGIELTILTNNFGPLSGGVLDGNVQLPSTFCLPRSLSMNREDAWNREAQDVIGNCTSHYNLPNEAAGQRYNYYRDGIAADPAVVTSTPNLANAGLGAGDSYGKNEAWAVLVRVWLVDNSTTGGVLDGDPIDVGAGEVARVLAVVHLGFNDIGNDARGGFDGHQLFLTDDPIYGGDGLGVLQSGGTTLSPNTTVHATIELMSGENQARSSPNRLCVPSLLEHGENPVGVADSPDTSEAPIRIGGSIEQGVEGVVKNGLRGRIDDFSMLVADLDSDTGNIYTEDHLPADAFFTGPADTRFQSLPRLVGARGNNSQDDFGNGWSGQPAALPTLTIRFDETSGDVVVKDGTESAPEVPQGALRRQGESVQGRGVHRIRVTYYDPDQLVESNPSEEFLVRVSGEDGAGDLLEAESSFRLIGLPVSGDRRLRLHRRIYKTFPDVAQPLLWIEVEDNTTSEITPPGSNVRLAAGDPLSFDRGRPPYCKAMEASEENMAYAGIDDAPNVAVVSQPFKPEHIRGTQISYGESGRGGGLVSISHLRGVFILGKRNAVFAVTPAGPLFRTQRMNSDSGFVSVNGQAVLGGVIYFPSMTGVYIYSGNQRVFDVSEVIQRLYRDGVDLNRMERASGAPLLERMQYLLSVVEKGEEEPQLILVTERRRNEFGDFYNIWAKMDYSIPVFSLGYQEVGRAQQPRAAMGSRGFAYEYDSGDGIGYVLDTSLYGPLEGKVMSGVEGRSVEVTLDGTPFTEADGWAGLPFVVVGEILSGEYCDEGHYFEVIAEGEIVRAVSTGGGLRLTTKDSFDWSKATNRKIILGGRIFTWSSKVFDLGNHETIKKWHFLDLVFDKVEGGFVFAEIFDAKDGERRYAGRVPLDKGRFSVPMNTVNSAFAMFKISGYGLSQGFALHKAALRADPDAWGRRNQDVR